MFETFDHTADLGLRVLAPDLNSLFVDAARGLLSILIANPEDVQPVQEVAMELVAERLDDLLFDWLNELLYRFDVKRTLFSQFDVQVGEGRLVAKAWGEPCDDQRHRLEHEVKAITYHGFKCERDATGWLAEVILDI